MKKLIIVGAGGFGRETFNWAKDAEGAGSEWRIGGFLDSNPRALDNYQNYALILGNPVGYQPNPEDLFICAIGNTKQKLEICGHLKKIGAQFATFIHPTAIIGRNTTIGKGSIICPKVVLTTDVTIGSHVILNVYASVGHDAVIGDGCTINGHCDINGFARLGQGVFLGSHASVLPHATVGDFATVGAGSVALRHIKPGATVFGVPAIKIKGFDSKQAKDTD